MGSMHPVQVIAVTGGKGGVGKTNVSVNLSLALAELGRRVMLLDADLGLALARETLRTRLESLQLTERSYELGAANGLTLAQTVAGLKEQFPHVMVMADCGSRDDAIAAEAAGVDILGTTLGGYSGERPKTVGPDWELVDQVVGLGSLPVMVEGRVHTVEQAAEALRRGAWSVCVGTAITHPATITSWFAAAVESAASE